MVGYLLRRWAQMGVTFVAFLGLVFLLIQAQPGDYTQVYTLDPNIPPESRRAIAAAFGLDRPVWQQFFVYLGNFFRGDLGVSFEHYPRSVMSVIMERLPRTLILFLTATVIAFYLGFVLGKLIAWRRGRAVEYVFTISGVYLYTVFTPWFALVLMWLFAIKLDWLPVGKFITPELWVRSSVDSNYVFVRLLVTAAAGSALFLALAVLLSRLRVPRAGLVLAGAGAASCGLAVLGWGLSGYGPLALDIAEHIALPILVLTLISFAGTMLLTRNSMLETMREDYVFAARARGLPDNMVRDRYVARNALLPVVTSFVFSLAFAIDGGVITETIFSWPGMGLTLLNAAVVEDIPLAVGAFVFTGVFVLVAHLVADVLYAFLDPRIRYR
ncbi:MAG: ABC transporter permease [Chloroflexi bacterium]|nr:ABC transporter permease [Chloroflexota bacterium]